MIKLGPAGSEGLGNILGIKRAYSMGARVYEVEFTHGVRMSKKQAEEIAELSKKLGMIITVHAPYFINLLSKDKIKRAASKKRILDSCKMGDLMNAKYIVFHPGFYGSFSKEEAFELMKEEIASILDAIKELGLKCLLAPETTGKISQWGDLNETIRIAKELRIGMTIDFAHLKARNRGIINYRDVIKKLPKRFHSHFSGIEWTDKGEKRHIRVDIEEFKRLAKELIKQDKDVTMINESPYIFEDLERMLKALKNL